MSTAEYEAKETFTSGGTTYHAGQKIAKADLERWPPDALKNRLANGTVAVVVALTAAEAKVVKAGEAVEAKAEKATEKAIADLDKPSF